MGASYFVRGLGQIFKSALLLLDMLMTILYFLIALVVASAVFYALRNLFDVKKLLFNSIAGVLTLLVLRYLLGIYVPLNLLTILFVALTGLLGVIVLLILVFLGLL